MCYSQYSDVKLKELNELEQSFLFQEKSKKLKLVSKRNRSGLVFKFKHQKKVLAMKLCYPYATDHDGNLIINDLINEANIYETIKGYKLNKIVEI